MIINYLSTCKKSMIWIFYITLNIPQTMYNRNDVGLNTRINTNMDRIEELKISFVILYLAFKGFYLNSINFLHVRVNVVTIKDEHGEWLRSKSNVMPLLVLLIYIKDKQSLKNVKTHVTYDWHVLPLLYPLVVVQLGSKAPSLYF